MAAQAPTMGRTLLDKGHELQEEYEKIVAARAANRRTLRDLDVQGLLSADEADESLELYPPRKTSDEDEADETMGDE